MVYLIWVMISFFAVIGLLISILFVVEFLALRKVHAVRKVELHVELAGEEPCMEYLLNTLSLKAQRLELADAEPVLVLHDVGLSPAARAETEAYCKKNPWVLFTDDGKNDII